MTRDLHRHHAQEEHRQHAKKSDLEEQPAAPPQDDRNPAASRGGRARADCGTAYVQRGDLHPT